MISFTIAYLLRLAMWGMAAALVQGGLLWLSWQLWSRALADSDPALRHRVACFHFTALLLLPAATVAALHFTFAGMGGEFSHRPLPAGFSGKLTDPAIGMVTCLAAGFWLAGTITVAFQLAIDAWRLARLDRLPPPAGLADAVARLARGMVGSKAVDVRTADVAVPQVVGFRRPVLVAPRDFTSSLPAAEQDAVLLHELAHVRRGDFGWNLLQRAVIMALWFHPAAWALHRRISREREACCDALAVEHGASPQALARGLVRLAETHGAPKMAMSSSGRGDLTVRVQRLIAPGNMTSASRNGPGFALAVSALCLAAIGAARLGAADPSISDLYIASAFGPIVYVDAHDASGSFTLRIRQGRVVEASVEDRPLPKAMILQKGDKVTLVGASRAPIVSLRVTAHGRIQWKSRAEP